MNKERKINLTLEELDMIVESLPRIEVSEEMRALKRKLWRAL
jgi:hypothetical protein